jgi:hypothetical protein
VLDLDAIESCAELTGDHAELAASSSQEMKKLLRRAAAISRPESGCPKLLLALGKLATAEWVEGELRVAITGDEDETKIELYCEHGLGIRERLLPTHSFYVPIDEFERALLLAPNLAAPLRPQQTANGLMLSISSVAEQSAPVFELEEEALSDSQRATAPPLHDPDQLIELPPEAEIDTAPPLHDPEQPIELPPDGELDTAPPPATAGYEEVVEEQRAAKQAAAADVHTRPTTRLAALTPDMLEALRRAKNA